MKSTYPRITYSKEVTSKLVKSTFIQRNEAAQIFHPQPLAGNSSLSWWVTQGYSSDYPIGSLPELDSILLEVISTSEKFYHIQDFDFTLEPYHSSTQRLEIPYNVRFSKLEVLDTSEKPLPNIYAQLANIEVNYLSVKCSCGPDSYLASWEADRHKELMLTHVDGPYYVYAASHLPHPQKCIVRLHFQTAAHG